MRIQTSIADDEFMDDCVSLQYVIEFGELHERDKYHWIEAINRPVDDDQEYVFKKTKTIDFEFKMNYIK